MSEADHDMPNVLPAGVPSGTLHLAVSLTRSHGSMVGPTVLVNVRSVTAFGTSAARAVGAHARRPARPRTAVRTSVISERARARRRIGFPHANRECGRRNRSAGGGSTQPIVLAQGLNTRE